MQTNKEDEDDDIESLVAARSAGTEDMEPGEYEAYVETQIAKAMGFRENTTNEAELSLFDLYYGVQLMVIKKLADELQESMTIQKKYEHGLISEEEFRVYQLLGKKSMTKPSLPIAGYISRFTCIMNFDEVPQSIGLATIEIGEVIDLCQLSTRQ
jgi:hypothetical protein